MSSPRGAGGGEQSRKQKFGKQKLGPFGFCCFLISVFCFLLSALPNMGRPREGILHRGGLRKGGSRDEFRCDGCDGAAGTIQAADRLTGVSRKSRMQTSPIPLVYRIGLAPALRCSPNQSRLAQKTSSTKVRLPIATPSEK